MTPFPTLADLPRHLHHPAVRDLAWALLAPPLLARPGLAQRHPLSASEWAAAPHRLEAWLQSQEQAPQPLEAWLAGLASSRLGLRFERLWQYALAQAPGVRLLASNLPVRQQGKTLGEMDLLLQDDHGIHHVELAIKLYLGPQEGGGHDAEHWCGTDVSDRLDLKLAHLRERQLPLSSLAVSRTALESVGAWPAQASAWLGGYLFYPWPGGCEAPTIANPGHNRGLWLHRRHCQALIDQHPDARWYPLPRPDWLGHAQVPAEQAWPRTQVMEWLAAQPPGGPAWMLARLAPEGTHWREMEQGLVVNDAWPATG